jgi:hypothetical protein
MTWRPPISVIPRRSRSTHLPLVLVCPDGELAGIRDLLDIHLDRRDVGKTQARELGLRVITRRASLDVHRAPAFALGRGLARHGVHNVKQLLRERRGELGAILMQCGTEGLGVLVLLR